MKTISRLGLGLVFALVLSGMLQAQTLTGSWTTTATIVPSPVTLGIDSELVVTYNVGTWSIAENTALDETGWTRQRFVATGTLGEVAFASTLTFAPATPAAFFSQWTTTATALLYGVTSVGTFSLTPGNVEFVLDGSGSLGAVDLRVVTTLGDTTPAGVCDFGWQGVGITVEFPFCCAEIRSDLDITCDGFESLTFRATNLAIPNLPWFTLTALLTFEVDEKSLVVTPAFSFGVDVCFAVYVGMGQSGNLVLSDFTIDGIGILCEIGGVEFAGQSYWGAGSKPSLLAGTPYWEAYQIRASGEECCGPLDVEITVYFLEGGVQLFDLAKLAGVLSVELGPPFTFSSGLSIELGPTTVTWTVGFLVEW